MGLLRIILALAVVISHSGGFFGLKSIGGLRAVQIFFIISGFYMSMILDKKYTGKGSYLLFLSNRFLRIYPVYWFILFLTIFISIISAIFTDNWFFISPYIEYFEVISVDTLIFQIITNIALFGQDISMFLGISTETGKMFFTHNYNLLEPRFNSFLLVPQAWSLGVELMFYMIAPWIVRRSAFLIFSIIIISISLRFFTYNFIGYSFNPWTNRFFPFELSLFLFGTISYRLYCSRLITMNLGKIFQIFIVLAYFSIIIFHQKSLEFDRFPNLFNWLLYCYTCLVLPILFEFSKHSNIDYRIGELSYPIYITHILIIFLLSPPLKRMNFSNFNGEVIVIVTIILAFFIVKYITNPIECIRQKRVLCRDTRCKLSTSPTRHRDLCKY
ncbi:MAG: acyltransferase [Desulfobulbaceae bacterium]|nr:MAG: acyltransferase [Desulfobulbaceae bacterium]